MKYLDGFVLAVPNANREVYREFAAKAAEMLKEHGATRVVESWGDDVPEGKRTSFTIATERKEDETAVFSWIEWPSKAVRDVGMKAFMEDPRLRDFPPMPFDGQRMFFGGFEPLVDG